MKRMPAGEAFITTVAWLMLIVIVGVCNAALVHQVWANQYAPAWVQAVGSIAAIIAGVWLAGRQRDIQHELTLEAEARQERSFVETRLGQINAVAWELYAIAGSFKGWADIGAPRMDTSEKEDYFARLRSVDLRGLFPGSATLLRALRDCVVELDALARGKYLAEIDRENRVSSVKGKLRQLYQEARRDLHNFRDGLPYGTPRPDLRVM